MVSFNNFIKTKSLNDNNKNKVVDNSHPTVTIIDLTQEKNVFVDDDEPIRKRCSIPERAFVTVVLSLYIFFGILITSVSFMKLAFSPNPLNDQVQYGINGSLSAFLAVAGIIGLTAMRNNNAILLRRLSISFWILTVLMLILNVIDYIISIVSKPEAVQKCQNVSNQVIGDDGEKQLELDCDQIINFILLRDAFQLLFIEAISIYFTYTIACYSKRLMTKSKTSEFRLKFNNNQKNKDNTNDVFTYQIYTTNSPPTSDDWKPPKYN